MKVNTKDFHIHEMSYTIRPAMNKDAKDLSDIRLRIDGETEHLDRVQGEAFIDVPGFEQMIKRDTENSRNLFLVVTVCDRVIGFSRCEGNLLQRFSHQAEFGVCVLKAYWGHGIGTNLLKESIAWADSSNIKKITLKVLETNHKAVKLYKTFGFEIEGLLKQDKLLADGKYYNTIIMGRLNESPLSDV